MSIGDWFRRLLSGPSEAAEKGADMQEEYGTPDEGEADVERMAETGGGGYVRSGSFAATEGAEAAEAELESEEAPPDPAP